MSNSEKRCCTEALLVRALDDELSPPQARRVKFHVQGCTSCRSRLDQLRRLSSRLQELHEFALPADAPADFKARIEQEEFRMEQPAPWWHSIARPRNPWRQLAWCGAVALVLVVGFRISRVHPTRLSRPFVQPPPIVSVTAPRRIPDVAATAGMPRSMRKTTRRHAQPQQIAVKQLPSAQAREIATPFFNLPFSDAALPLDQAMVIRVDLPMSSLEFAGLPVDESRTNGRLQADVVLGADGLARAIRFVQ